MNKFIWIILILVAITIGWSFILFVYMMSWSPPHHMGMMVGRATVYSQMFSWLRGTFFLIVLIVTITLIIWYIHDKKKK
ncbi:hypothetical protein BHF71_01695 [Vulcanibacillus modesticaldus]|uniref:Uncharacterized protein n=1 Tax=Vulcanibacillus modesticaldus TaxID=337097 RepID=A0A1D2YUE3_9BACI|nr:hypothetical protein [Vulcanibacillus modesticaldus]OEF99330.1 hypothetical protein BHF71_01695 [Vulcanibacillus modesticaldus]